MDIEHESEDERWLLLDVDHCAQGTHLQQFTEALREARQRGISVALSKPCFELRLLLHCVEETALDPLPTAKDVEKALRDKLGQYNKTNLNREHFPLNSVCDACTRAGRLDATVGGGDIPEANTTRVYRLVKAIVSSALPSQLPPELRRLC